MKVIAKVININFNSIYEYIKITPWRDINSYLKSDTKDWDGTDLWGIFHKSDLFVPPWRDEEFCKDDRLKKFETLYNARKELNKSIDVIYRNDFATFIVCGTRTEVFPSQFVEVEEVIDFDKVTIAEASKLLGFNEDISETALANVDINISIEDLQKNLDEAKNAIKVQEENIKAEVARIEEETRLKVQEMKKQMQVKIQELELKKKEMEKNIFDMDLQLYSLRCLLGDSVDVVQLRKGTKAPLEQPVVIFQKLRYLDEDLAKLKAIYNYVWENTSNIEKVLAKDDYVFDLFCPNDKCIVLFKVCRSTYGYCSGADNTLSLTENENGNRVAILIRNGENLHIIWTEEERIYLKENFIVARGNSTSYEVGNIDSHKEDMSDIITSQDYTNPHDKAWVQYFSRRFLITILQGLSTYQKIIEFPEEVNFATPSSYILFSMADNQLADNSYGSLADYMEYTGRLTKQGDTILPIKSIAGSFSEANFWGSGYHDNHERGRGDKNRVWDCYIKDDIQVINLVDDIIESTNIYPASEKDIQFHIDRKDSEEIIQKLKSNAEEYNRVIKIMREKDRDTLTIDNITYKRRYASAGAGYIWKENNSQYRELNSLEKQVHTTDPNDFKYYVAVEKKSWGERKTDRKVSSNVQIYPDEFINLTWLSSEILRYYLNTKQVGKHFAANYAYAINYLHKAISFIEKREKEEKEYFKTIVDYNFEDIPHFESLVIAYKIKNNIHKWNSRTVKGLMTWIVAEVRDYDKEYYNILGNLPWVKKGE